jgi:release factor glutamine methyltransferase
LAEGEHALADGPHPARARLDAETLFLHVLRQRSPEVNRAWLIAHANNPTRIDTRSTFELLVSRRLTGEPIQYITGETEFYGLPFRVKPDVLIPRPETEHLVEAALKEASNWQQSEGAPSLRSIIAEGWEISTPTNHLRILDIGTGSGAIAIALAHQLPEAQLTAIDVSRAALNIARQNAAGNGVSERIRFLHGDLLAPVADEQFEIIVSNPPYVPTTDKPTLSVEVREHEPALALFAGEDGLEIYRSLIPAAHTALVAAGALLLEIGYGQSGAIATLLNQAGFDSIEFIPDLQGIPRVICARRP